MLNIILFGPPGSGKGTQANFLAETYNLHHLSTGDLFRYNIGNKTPLGIEAQAYMDQGKLVPDDVTIAMLKDTVLQHNEVAGFIFDGFPRTTAQTEALELFMTSQGEKIDALVMLEVTEEEIVSRLLERGKTSGRVDDQNEETIRKRIAVYREETQPVYDFYERKDCAYQVNGLGTIEEITARLKSVFEHLKTIS